MTEKEIRRAMQKKLTDEIREIGWDWDRKKGAQFFALLDSNMTTPPPPKGGPIAIDDEGETSYAERDMSQDATPDGA